MDETMTETWLKEVSKPLSWFVTTKETGLWRRAESLLSTTLRLLSEVDLSPVPFSPDDDNVDDELKIALNVQDISPIRDWEMSIKDPKGNDFISFGGRGRPSERIIWDGRSRQGELVQSAEDYPYEIRVTDYLGHSTVERGKIPVDILVIRDGDRLKVQISNITFQAYKQTLCLPVNRVTKTSRSSNGLQKFLKSTDPTRFWLKAMQ